MALDFAKELLGNAYTEELEQKLEAKISEGSGLHGLWLDMAGECCVAGTRQVNGRPPCCQALPWCRPPQPRGAHS